MSLEKVFEAWYDKCRADCSVRLGSKAQEWVVWNAGYEAAQPKWIPYKEGDVVEDGWYLVTYWNGARGFIEYDHKGWWGEFDVIAYCHVPAPYGGE